MHLLWYLWIFLSYCNIAIIASYMYIFQGWWLTAQEITCQGIMSLFFSLIIIKPTCRACVYTTATTSSDVHLYPRYGLDTTRFQKAVQEYYISWLAPAPETVYQT